MKRGHALAVALAGVMLAGCESESGPANNPARTQIVAEYEDCKVYYSKTTTGPDVSWVRCESSNRVQSYTVRSCGKNCTQRSNVQTVEGKQ